MRSSNTSSMLCTVVVLASVAAAATASAQTISPSGASRSSVQQLPLSGRQSTGGSVSTGQNAIGGGSNSSANTVNTNVQVSGSYAGSVLDRSVTDGTLTLTLRDAIRRGLQFNLGSISAKNTDSQVRAQRLLALSALLPAVDASFSFTEEKESLKAEGLGASTIPSLGESLPSTIGPFHYYDARGTASQKIFDKTALDNYASAKSLERASALSQNDARELTTLAISSQYLRTLSDIALVQSQEAQVRYAQASYDQAAAQNRAGTKARIDAQRSLVELQTEQQRLSSNRADLEKQELTLLRAMGVPLRIKIKLVETLPYHEVTNVSLDTAVQAAEANRPDLKAAAQQLKAAEQALKASHSERLPTASASGYYGIEGINPNAGNGVFGVTGSVSIPIFDGRRISADIAQASATLSQRRAEYQDQEQNVELDVRNALIDLDVASNQVKVAESNRKLALDTLKQSQDRFTEGVTDSVEVVQSAETLASAERDFISSLYSHNVAKLSLARAMGELEKDAPGILEEK
ncbi:MAG: TolC family protein [Acidobacteriaceae bacterium]|nr:TolC family protein [Acidobacteriaceae bacterium]